MEINIDNKKYNALTFIANDERTGLGLRPTESYKSLILDGSEFFSSEYQKEVENFPTFESKISQKNATTKELNQIVSFLNVC